MTKLEICIPTYDRPACLRQTVQCLLEQLDATTTLRILDNHSPEPVTHERLGVSDPVIRGRVCIERSSVNIGGNANIARCFERCQADYMWLLGDDDELAPDALETMVADIKSRPECVIFNYCLPRNNRKRNMEGSGLDAFLKEIDRWGNCMLISNNVYRVPAFKPYVICGYHYAYSQAPHMAILLEKLRVAGGDFFFSSQSIILGNMPTPAGGNGWSLTHHGLARMALLDLPFTGPQRARLKELIVGEVKLFNHAMAYALLIAKGNDVATARHYLRKVYRDNFAEPFRIGYGIRYWLCQLALLAPETSVRLIQLSLGSSAMDPVRSRETSTRR